MVALQVIIKQVSFFLTFHDTTLKSRFEPYGDTSNVWFTVVEKEACQDFLF